MRESNDYSHFETSANASSGGALYELARTSLNRSQSMSIGSGRYTNKPLPAVPQIQPGGTTVVSSITAYNGSYDMVETRTTTTTTTVALPTAAAAASAELSAAASDVVGRVVRRSPPTPPPKPSRGSKTPTVAS